MALFNFLLILILAVPVTIVAQTEEIIVHETKDHIRFGLWSKTPTLPAPTVILFDPGTPEMLHTPKYKHRYQILVDQGYLCVAVDFPCQGRDERAGEPKALNCWRYRVEQLQDNFVEDMNVRTSRVLTHLIKEGYTNPERVLVAGTSSGGFLALHYMASDLRIKGGAVFSPVTNLSKLHEFKGIGLRRAIRKLALTEQADRLASRLIWLVMGDRDERVGTNSAVQLAQRVWQVSAEKNLTTGMELHVVPEPKGHDLPPGTYENAASWMLKVND